MSISTFIKSPKYFYSAIAVTFGVFVILILLTGRQIYESEKQKLYDSKSTELNITRVNFEQRLDEVELELRRLVNVMKLEDLFEKPDPAIIKSFVSDFLFDHHYLTMILYDNDHNKYFKIDSPNAPIEYSDFLSKSGGELFDLVPVNKETNNIIISKELKMLYLVKFLPNNIGHEDKCLLFFFSPELLLKYLPSSYALLLKGEGIQWIPASKDFPQDFTLPEDTESANIIKINDTQSVFYVPLRNNNANYFLASLSDMLDVKNTLVYSTFFTLTFFTGFFGLIMVLIYLRNNQISQLMETQKATVVCLANLAEFKDNETADHLERTRHYGTLLSNYLRQYPQFRSQINRDYLDNIGFASVLHDIGKVGVPDSILKKPGKLTDEEFEVIKQHPIYAKGVLKDLVSKHKVNDMFFNLGYNIAVYHHEKWDGSGYPEGLKGEEIPLEARIFSVCDVYDALRSERVYKKPFSHDKAMTIINEGRGSHFDPVVIDAINACADQFKKIHDTYDLFYRDIAYSSFGNNRRELKVEWTEALEVGIPVVDEQHKVLLNRINLLIKSIMAGKGEEDVLHLLRFLESYVEEHFTTEEMILLATDDPLTEGHVDSHNVFRQNFRAIYASVKNYGVTEDSFSFIEKNIISWLLNHILEYDVRMIKDS
jgi:hemerythrin